jgi:hypothetical protein
MIGNLVIRFSIGAMFLAAIFFGVAGVGASRIFSKTYDLDVTTSAISSSCEKAIANGEYTAKARNGIAPIEHCVEDTFMATSAIGLAFIVAASFEFISAVFLIISIVSLVLHIQRIRQERRIKQQ